MQRSTPRHAPDDAITIDVTSALKQGGGIGRATRGLVWGLAALDAQRPYRLLHARDAVPNPTWPLGDNFYWHALPFDERQSSFLWHRLAIPMPLEWIGVRSALYHGPDYIVPPLRHTPSLVTIHDLSYELFDNVHEAPLRAYLQRAVPRSIERADQLIAVSQSTRDELIRCYDLSPEQISVIYSGVEPRFRPLDVSNAEEEALLEQGRATFRLDRPFVLCVATIEPRKNLSTLVRAFAQFRRAHPESDAELLLAGGRGWLGQREKLTALIQAEGLGGNVRLLGFVDDDLLPALLNEARLLAYPSLHEGFGLPVLEALACGTPTITARNSSLPEAGGDAAYYIDQATDIAALAHALATVWYDATLRATMRERGLAHASQFTWQRTAQQALALYQRMGAAVG